MENSICVNKYISRDFSVFLIAVAQYPPSWIVNECVAYDSAVAVERGKSSHEVETWQILRYKRH